MNTPQPGLELSAAGVFLRCVHDSSHVHVQVQKGSRSTSNPMHITAPLAPNDDHHHAQLSAANRRYALHIALHLQAFSDAAHACGEVTLHA